MGACTECVSSQSQPVEEIKLNSLKKQASPSTMLNRRRSPTPNVDRKASSSSNENKEADIKRR